MSQNPYAPPQAVLATPKSFAEGSGTVDLGRCMQEAWRDTWANFPLWLVAGIVWVLATIAGLVSVIGIVFAVPILYWGGYVFFLRMHDGGATMGDLFSGFSRYGQALVAMIGYFIAMFLIGLPGQILTQLGVRPPTRFWLLGLGYAISLGIALFVTSRLNFAPFLVVDRNLGIGESLSLAWSRTAALKGPIALLLVLTMVSVFVSLLALIVGVIPGTVFAFLLWVSAYRQIFGGPRAS